MPKKELNRNFSVYDLARIEDWGSSLASIPNTIDSEKERIRQHQANLKYYQDKLKKLQDDALHPIEKLIENLTSQIQFLTLPTEIEALKDKITPLELDVATGKAKLENVNQTICIYENTIKQLRDRVEIKILSDDNFSKNNNKNLKEKEKRELSLALANKKEEVSASDVRVFNLKKQLDQLTNVPREPLTVMPVSGPSGSAQQNNGLVQTNASGCSTSFRDQQNAEKDNEISRLREELENATQEYNRVNREKKLLDTQIKTLETDIGLLSNTISINNKHLIAYSDDDKRLAQAENIDSLRLEVSKQVSKQIPYDQEKLKLSRDLKKLNDQLSSLTSQHEQLTAKFTQCKTRRGAFAKHDNVEILKNMLNEQQQLRAPLLKDEKELSANVALYQKNILTGNRKIDNLQNEYKDLNANDFMWKLRAKPEELFSELAEQIRKAVARFEDKHPARQSDQVRKSLVDILIDLEKIEAITPYESTYCNYTQSFKGKQVHYFQLCGLLWDQYKKLNPKKDFEWLNELHTILQCNRIEDQLAIGEYKKLDLKPPQQKLEDKEEEAYHAAFKKLQNLIAPMESSAEKEKRKLYIKGKKLLDNMTEKKGNEEPDSGELKFHTTILQSAAKLAQAHELKDEERFKRLIHDNEDGKPSLCKQIFGAALAFFSMVASIAVSLTLPPFGWIGSAVCGTAGTAAGVGLFVSGRSKDTDKALKGFGNAAAKIKFFEPAPSQSEPDPIVQEPPTMPAPSAPPMDEDVDYPYLRSTFN